jgi:hypothetical protein
MKRPGGPREAWSDGLNVNGGHESLPDESIPPRQRAQFGSQASRRREDDQEMPQTAAGQSAGEMLRLCLYNPPVSFEQLAGKMKVSQVTANPSITKAAFQQR